ncbi:mechanosensitive ion channel domain-containing protein [Rathayibacter sp. YIM 133350]|uniref:mechanosensitive ion channel family protein n=1 Tax=Rathayibacter sp. YIM 133350 TaxID=3131992 RepID=UPI00307FB85E
MLDEISGQTWWGFAIAVIAALIAAALLSLIGRLIVTAVGRRRQWPSLLLRRVRWPFRLTVLMIGVWIAVGVAMPSFEGRSALVHVLLVASIVVGTWLVCGFVLFGIDVGTTRYRIDVADNKVARRVRTQLLIVRRLVVVTGVVVAVGASLLSFPEVRVVGASVLASAGLLSVVAGLAAQSTLANVFAGLQLAFSEAIRVDDVVVVNGEWGRIGEITLSYVVVNLWDERRLVLPCTYFTTQPFENWTREGSALMGAVEFDLDWRVSPAAMRDHLARIVATTDLWDGRTSVLQVTDAVAGYVHVRILVTAMDAPTLFDLRCHVREEMVAWLQGEASGAVPRQRVELVEAAEPTAQKRSPRASAVSEDQKNLFSGSPEAEERAAQFTSAIPIVTGSTRAQD